MSEHDDPIPFPHKPEAPICLCGRINARHCPVHHENVHLGALETLLNKPEPPPAQAPREWWIKQVGHWPGKDEVYDRHNDIPTGCIHVIEYAAYERLERQLAEANIERESIGKSFASLEQELTQARAELELMHKGFADRTYQNEQLEKKSAALVDALTTILDDPHDSSCALIVKRETTSVRAWGQLDETLCTCHRKTAREALSKHGETT